MILLAFLFAVDPSIIFVHLGKRLPDYLPVAVAQARLFHPDNPIVLLANEEALVNAPEGIECVACETLPRDPAHMQFQQRSQIDRSFREGFWTYTTERFFYLYEFMKQRKLDECFHLENDVMLYTDLKTLLPTFRERYQGKIAATFDNENRCIAGFPYISTLTPLQEFIRSIAARAYLRYANDMEFLAKFRQQSGQYIDTLPIIMPAYAEDHPLESTYHHKANNPETFFHHANLFASLFDAAAIGQYLGGIDPNNGPSQPGFINESCVFQPNRLQFEWLQDEAGRWIPFANYRDQQWRINNLHIHSKQLQPFYSLRNP